MRGWLIGLSLALPFVAYLAIPVYSRVHPRILGFPFFYWYQFAWVVGTAVIIALAYRFTNNRP